MYSKKLQKVVELKIPTIFTISRNSNTWDNNNQIPKNLVDLEPLGP